MPSSKKFHLLIFRYRQKFPEMFVVTMTTVPNASFLLVVYYRCVSFKIIQSLHYQYSNSKLIYFGKFSTAPCYFGNLKFQMTQPLLLLFLFRKKPELIEFLLSS
jgi:hypothetical protein